MTHLHRGGAPEQRQDEGRAPARRGELQGDQVPALALHIGAVLGNRNLWSSDMSFKRIRVFNSRGKYSNNVLPTLPECQKMKESLLGPDII